MIGVRQEKTMVEHAVAQTTEGVKLLTRGPRNDQFTANLPKK